MSERRYDDDEVAAIFELAADDRTLAERPASQQHGLTLDDLQTIGRDVGIAPEAITRAAVALDSRPVQRRFFGLPIGVSRTVELNRRMSDDEWERLVVHLREVFHARGTTRRDGSLRQWTNGNLHVLLEPTATGHRLRLGTYHGGARASITAGAASLATMAATVLAAATTGSIGRAAPGIAMLAVGGLAMIANGAIRLPRWARLRERQLDDLAAEVASARPAPVSDED
jgi:hypothetical protein